MIDFERPKMSPISPPRSPRPQKKPKLDSALEFKSKKSQPVVGTCKKLEKQFFRMTSKPDPSTVRPERILKRALSKFQAMWS